MAAQTLGVLAIFAILSVVLVLKNKKRRHAFPPGPLGLPLIGNALDLPKSREWLAYQKWGRDYGSDVVFLDLVGTPVAVLNSLQAAKDLLEKRSRIYSDRSDLVRASCRRVHIFSRPYSVMIQLTGWGRNIGLMPYGDTWRAHRRSFNQYFQERAIDRYLPQIDSRVQIFLRFLLEDPDDFIKHIRFSAGALLLEVAYGLNIEDEDSPYIVAAERAVDAINQIGNAGAFLVDVLPILRHLPSWFPGAGFKRQAAEWKMAVLETYNLPWSDAKEQISAGGNNVSVTSLLLAREEGSTDQSREAVIQNVAGIAFAAGEDTTTSTLSTFFLAMTLNPTVVIAAQAEIDRVCGLGRLPSFEDKDVLPFVTAVMFETMRWRPALPLGVAHRSTADDEYKGFFIPAGTITMSNSWAILHDEEKYPDPERFNPWRFLGADGHLMKDITVPESVFGFGRRICPGRYFVLQALWLTMARVLAAFKIEKPVDSEGKIIEPSGEFSSGVIIYPLPFKTTIKPRSLEVAQLVRNNSDHVRVNNIEGSI